MLRHSCNCLVPLYIVLVVGDSATLMIGTNIMYWVVLKCQCQFYYSDIHTQSMKFNDTVNKVNGGRTATKPESQPAIHHIITL